MSLQQFQRRFVTLALLALLPAGAGGCGLFLVHGPPAGHESLTAFSCTSGNAGPVADGVVAGTALLVGLPLVSAGRGDIEGWTAPYVVAGAGFVLEGALFTTSAVVGLRKTARCREALRRLAERAARPPMPVPPR